jgi:hypothetical protein
MYSAASANFQYKCTFLDINDIFLYREVPLYVYIYVFHYLTVAAIFHPGDNKEHLKVTLLRVDSSLQGVLSCLPDFNPSSRNGMVEDPDHAPFLIAGATGLHIGSSELREKAAEVIHAACK